MQLRHKNTALVLLFLALIVMPKSTFAYIDPGSGSFLIQMLIASLAGITYVARVYIMGFFYFVKHKVLRIKKNNESLVMDNIDSDEIS